MTSTPSLLKTAALLALLAALGGCTTLSNRPLCPATTDTSFWFRLDPKLLATQTRLHRYPYSYNARFDPLFAKCEFHAAQRVQK